MEIIRKSAQQAADLARKLLGFSRQQSGETIVTNINQLMLGMQSLITRSVTLQVEVECLFAQDLWLTRIDPGILRTPCSTWLSTRTMRCPMAAI